ncbi:GRIP and coiled-coil domain-containing protein 2 isoform X2 [Coccinella septempunctata]|uniref:GRIP and coiled-coil domain-containing protein 2 isoform X2 n=1 Tax=Coccinella septempunctata TaxID=41139 RepID=UPI001D095647|nr:GRIP and coiled-coil domain-containing protein 2 isoform X2 [Coccinella septempunctata]
MMENNKSSDKKINFEDLSKEELVTKCNALLSIIQKAKQSKGILQEEIEHLKAKLEHEINIRKASPSYEESIEMFTQQKANLVSDIEDLRLQNDALMTTLNQYIEEKKKTEVDLFNLDNENVALKKQVKRLSDDNEQFISHLESLEKQIEQLNEIGLDQQKQLLKLEENNVLNSATKENEKIQELEKMLRISLDEIKKMKSVEDNGEDQGNSQNCDSYDLNNKFKEKLRVYHSKIIKLAMNVKELKNDRELILKQFKMYVNQVKDWKDQLYIASNNFLKLLGQFQKENEHLKTQNLRLANLNEQFMRPMEVHKTDDEKSKDLEDIHVVEVGNSTLIGTSQGSQRDNIIILNKTKHLTTANDLETNRFQKELLSLHMKIKELVVEKEELHRCVMKEKDCSDQFILLSMEKTDELKQKVESFLTIIEKYDLEKASLIEEITKLKEMLSNQKLKMEDMYQQNMKLLSELEKSSATEKQLAEKSGEEMLKLVEEIEILTNNNSNLNVKLSKYEQTEEMNNCRKYNEAYIQTENEFIAEKEFDEKILLLKTENSQLLTEMNEMNQELKERGENVSKLEAHCTEMKKKIKVYESQANSNVNNISEKEETIKELNFNILEKEKIITDLKNELELLKERLNSNFENVEIDNMSTSTVSKVEEMDRLKDLEGSWEEKYGKLKNLAIKLKAKLKEKINEVNNEKLVKVELHQKLNNAYEKLKVLQLQYECINNELVERNKKCQECLTRIAASEETIEEKDNILSVLRSEITTLQEEKLAADVWKKQISVKVQTLRKELESNEVAKHECETKLLALKSHLEAKEFALKSEMENHRKTKNSLKHFTNENKKHTVLNLEMQDYEKSIKDLSLKLERKNEQIAKMKEQIDCQKQSYCILDNQKNDLQEKIEFYESSLNAAVNEKSACLKKLSETDNILKHKTENIANLLQQLEILRSQNEELYTSLSSDIMVRQKIIDSLREEKENLQVQNLNIQQNNKELQEMLSSKEEELSIMNKDFENYKIRAQSVLRQNQNRDIGLEEKLNENVCSLLSQIQVLNSEINDFRISNKFLKDLNETLRLENTSLISNQEKLSENLKDMKDRFEKLQLKYDQTVNEHNDTVRSLKIQAETLSQCFRQQLSEQEVRHNREIIELHSRIEKSQIPEIPLPALPSITREEGEGSESTESLNNLPVSLEKLLSEEDEHKINILKKQMGEQESKLHHLTELLAETEQDLAKHIQMNKVLKEEIRRQQRAVEREKHAENMEYLKNVVLKAQEQT